MGSFLETAFSAPALPATILLLLVCLYWLSVIAGVVDLGFLDIDFDLDADPQATSILSIGFVPLRFLNIGQVPLMLWLSIFGFTWWLLSMLIGVSAPAETSAVALAIARDVGLGLLVTKGLTTPLKGRFEYRPPHPTEELIGSTCVITTSEATPDFGQAEYKTESAPLRLNVRSVDEPLHRGEVVEIVDFDPERHVFYVSRASGATRES